MFLKIVQNLQEKTGARVSLSLISLIPYGPQVVSCVPFNYLKQYKYAFSCGCTHTSISLNSLVLIKELNKKLFTLKYTNIKKYLVVGEENLYYNVTNRGYRWIYQEKKKKRQKRRTRSGTIFPRIKISFW